VAGLALTAATPLLSGRMVAGHDALEHATRTAEYARALADGIWWPGWAPDLGHGYGEPVFMFNPPLFYVLAAVPVLAGLPVVSAVNLACILLLAIGGLGMYAWSVRFLGKLGGLVAATAYVWAPYVLLDLYVRQALTELAAACVLPWSLWALARTCEAPGRRRVALAAVAVGGLLLTSTPAAVVTAPALVGQIIALFHARRPAAAARSLAALALGALLSASFWVPALTERQQVRFDRLLTGQPAYYNHFVEPWQLLSSNWGYGVSVPGPNDGMGFGLGEAHLVLAACALVLIFGRHARGVVGRQLWLAVALVALGAGLSMELTSPIWDRVAVLQYLQFPWRFLLLAALGCATLAAAPATLLSRRHPSAATAAAALSISLIVVCSWGRAQPGDLVAAFDEKFTSTAIANRDRAQGTAYEYETIWTEGRPGQPARSRLLIQSGSADIVQVGGSSQQQRFKLTARTRTRLRLSTFYFPGWRVFVDDHERPIEYWNPSGLIEFVVERGEHVVEARFEPTPEGWLGRALAGLGLLALVLTFAWGASWPAVGAIWIRGATRIPPPLPPQGRKALPPAPLPLRERGGG